MVGVSLGSASFTLTADSSGLQAALAAAQTASKAAADAIASATRLEAAAYAQLGVAAVKASTEIQHAIATEKAAAESAVQAAKQAQDAYQAMAAAAKASSDSVIASTLRQVEAANKAADARAAATVKIIRASNDEITLAKRAADERGAATLKLIKADNDAAVSSGASSQAIVRGFGQIAAASTAATGEVGALTAAFASAAGPVAAVAVAVGLLAKGFADVAEQATIASGVQFGLNKIYGDGTGALAAFAEQQSRTTTFTKTEYEQAAVALEAFNREGGLTIEQDQQLLKIAADLAAVHGITLVKALKDEETALKGRGLALSQDGILINKKLILEYGNLTDAQKANFDSLDEVTVVQASYNALVAKAAADAGAATEATSTYAGSLKQLSSSVTNLETDLGKGLGVLTPFVQTLNVGVNAADRFVLALDPGKIANIAVAFASLISPLTLIRSLLPGDTTMANAIIAIGRIADTRQTPEQAETARQQASSAAEQKAAADQHDIRLQQGKEAIDALKAAHDARVQDIADQKTALERKRDAEVKAAEASKQTQLDSIRDQAQAARLASEAELGRLRDEEAAKKKAVEDEKQAALDGIAAEKQAYDDAAAEKIRQAEIVRDHLLQAVEAEKTGALDALDAEKRVRDAARVLEDRAEADSVQARERDLSDVHQYNTRIFEDEAKAAQRHKEDQIRAIDDVVRAAEKAHQDTLRHLDDEAKAEDDKHRKKLANIESEAKSATDALDVQIRQLDDAQKAQDNTGRTEDLQRKLKDAQDALLKATGTGTPDQIAGARANLTQALHLQATGAGNDISVANAREDLNKLAGQGAEAVKKAQADLANAQRDLKAETDKEDRDSQKQQLEDKKASISAQLAIDKSAEDERDRQRKDRVAKDKQAADDTLAKEKDSADKSKRSVEDSTKAYLDDLEKRKRQDQDNHEAAVNNLKDQVEQEKRGIADRRTAEDNADRDSRIAIDRRAKAEQDAVKATYDAEETGIIPAIRRAQKATDEGYAAQTKAAEENARASIAAIDDTYNNHDHGLIPLAEQAAAATALSFQNQTQAVERESANQIAAIKSVYTNDDGTGLLDQLAAEKIALDAALKEDIRRYEEWKAGLVGEQGVIKQTFDKAQEIFDAWIKHITENKGTVTVDGNFDPNAQGPGDSGTRFGPPAPGGAGSSASVPEPYRVTFPFDAPYNGPFAGGAAWPGGPSRHRGVDLALPGPDNGRGAAYGAFQAGTVEALIPESQDPAGGNGILIRTKDGLYNYYGHNDSFLVSQGEDVSVGQKIGTLGRSGLDPGMQTHLHYEVRRGMNGDPVGSTIDPVPYMSGGAGQQKQAGGRTFTFTLFGHTFTVTLPGGGNHSATFQELLKAAQLAAHEFNLPADIMAAIPINEGLSSQLQTKYHNLFSIKGTGPAGSVSLPTDEIINGQRVTINDDFRVYHNEAESFEDFGKLVRRSGIYDDAVNAWDHDHDPREFMHLLGHHYATDPNFADQVLNIAGYRNGGWIPTDSLIVDAATMTPYARAGEAGPERVLSHADSAAWAGRGGSSFHEGDINVSGVGMDEVAAEIERRQHARDLLRGRVRAW